MKKHLYIPLLLLLLSGCVLDDTAYRTQPADRQVSFTADMTASGLSRTAIADDMLSTLWCADDKISLWAENSDGQKVLSGEQFTYTGEENAATGTFVATIAAMTAGTYTYTAAYPAPLSTDGSKATYEIARQQNGAYGAGQDILLAVPASDKALTQRSCNLSLGFTHVLHAFKVSIPEGCNGLGDRISRIDISFPASVTGTAVFDIDRPETAAAVTGENTVSLVPERGTDAGENPLWVFIVPCDASQTDIQIDVYTEFDHQRLSVAGRNFEKGHITPLKLNIPESGRVRTLVQLDMAENNLGQVPQQVIITAPEEVNLGGELSAPNVLVIDTPNFGTDGYQRFELSEQADDISGMELDITYISQDARVAGKITIPEIVAGQTNRAECRVPYLMSQDFGSLQKYTDEATTGSKDLGSVGLSGWSASRSNGTAGSHVSLRPFWAFGRFQSRMDSAPLGDAIIAGHSVNIVVRFTAGAEKVSTPLQVGSTTSTGSIDSGTEISNLCGTITLSKGSNSSPSEYTFEVSGAGQATRLSWRTNITSGSWGTYSDTPIDNIRVSIK